jgi:hypothetical protein
MRYRLRTLLILMAVLPPLLAAVWFYPRVVSPALDVIHVAGVIGLTVLMAALVAWWADRSPAEPNP